MARLRAPKRGSSMTPVKSIEFERRRVRDVRIVAIEYACGCGWRRTPAGVLQSACAAHGGVAA